MNISLADFDYVSSVLTHKLLIYYIDSLQQMMGSRSDENATNPGARLTRGQTSGNVSLGGPPKSLPRVEGETQYEYEFEEVEEKTMADTR